MQDDQMMICRHQLIETILLLASFFGKVSLILLAVVGLTLYYVLAPEVFSSLVIVVGT